MSLEKGHHLVMIIDMDANSRLLHDGSGDQVYLQWLDSIIAFANSHLLMSNLNKLTMIGSTCLRNTIIYPDGDEVTLEDDHQGQFELFAKVSQVVSHKLRTLIAECVHLMEDKESAGRSDSHATHSSLLSTAIGMALCCINKCTSQYKSRITILSSNDDVSTYASQYMNFMNAFFAAQKQGIVIDVCVTGGLIDGMSGDMSSYMTSTILQQGSQLTDGIYLCVPQMSALLEYLIWCFLPDIDTRSKLVLPVRKKISHPAACFCHRNLIDIGFVCSVCLSIFCTFNPICSTCHTSFKLKSLKSPDKKRHRLSK